MTEHSVIEFYNPEGQIASVRSAMVPPEGSFINIRKRTYQVKRVTYALDHSESFATAVMRANVDLETV